MTSDVLRRHGFSGLALCLAVIGCGDGSVAPDAGGDGRVVRREAGSAQHIRAESTSPGLQRSGRHTLRDSLDNCLPKLRTHVETTP